MPFLFCSAAFTDDALDCSSEHLVNMTLTEQQTRQIGDHKCETTLTIDNVELAKNSSLKLNYGNYTLKRLVQNKLAGTQWFRSHSTIQTINALHDANISINNSTLTQTGQFDLNPGAKINLYNSTLTIESTIHVINPNNSFRLADHSSLRIKGNIVLEINKPDTGRHFFISSKESAVSFFSTGVEAKVNRRVYIPSTFSIHLIGHHDTSSRHSGSFRLIRNNSIARKFTITSGGKITRPSRSDVYSKAALHQDTREAARLLDGLIPEAEVNPYGREARTLAYFDHITDQSVYEREVFTFQLRHALGHYYPEPFLERFLLSWQELGVLSFYTITSLLFKHCCPESGYDSLLQNHINSEQNIFDDRVTLNRDQGYWFKEQTENSQLEIHKPVYELTNSLII